MSNARIDYVLNGVASSQTVAVDAVPSALAVMRRHRAQVQQLVVGVTVPQPVLLSMREVAKSHRLNLSVSALGV